MHHSYCLHGICSLYFQLVYLLIDGYIELHTVNIWIFMSKTESVLEILFSIDFQIF
jgi:hypothetical protein